MEGENLVVGGCRERVMCTLNYRVVTSKFQKHSKTLKRILSKIRIHYINYYTHVTWAGAYLYGGGAKDRMKSTKMTKIAGVLILVLVICPTITSATETRGGRDDDLSDDKIWTSLIAFHYPGLVVPPICIEDIAKKCGWNNLTPACVMEEMDSCH